eukprot:SAG25_NODE_807_length_5249_cov_3.894369_3_plen_31_part_00
MAWATSLLCSREALSAQLQGQQFEPVWIYY